MTTRTLTIVGLLLTAFLLPNAAGAAPVVNLSVASSTIAQGQSTTLSWSVTGATSCSATGFSTGGAMSGSVTISPSSNTVYGISCTDGALAWSSGSVSHPNQNNACVPAGDSTTNTCPSTVPTGTSCTTQAATCARTVKTDSGDFCNVTRTTYTCAPTSPVGDSEFVRVKEVSATLSASPTTVAPGARTVLTWSSTGATTCTGSGFSTSGATSGSVSVTPSGDTVYSVSCHNGEGDPSDPMIWTLRETDTSDLGINGSDDIRANPNDPPLPYGSMTTCSPSNPSGQSCSTWSSCKFNTWRRASDPNDYVLYTNLYQCGNQFTGEIDTDSVTVFSVTPTLIASCSISPAANRLSTGTTVTWSAQATGGSGSYTYSWTGTQGLMASSSSLTKIYNYASGYGTWQAPTIPPYDPETGTVTVTSGGQTASKVCSVRICGGPGDIVFDGNDSAPYPVSAVYNDDVRCCELSSATGGQYKNDRVCQASGGLSDLIAGAITPTTAVAGTALHFASTISNIGPNSTGAAFSVLFKRANNSVGTGATNILTATSTPALTAGASRVVYRSYTFPPQDAGTTVWVQACADSTAEITESNDDWSTSNCGPWTAVVVSQTGMPDLTADAVTYTPTIVTANSDVTLRSAIQNIGTTTTGATFTNLFQIAKDAPAEYFEDTFAMRTHGNGILPAASTTLATAVYKFPTDGDWYVRACADKTTTNTDVIDESDEDHNCSDWTRITIIPPSYPDLTCEVDSFVDTDDDQQIDINEAVTFLATPSDIGTNAYTWDASDASPLTGRPSTYTRSFSAIGSYQMDVSTPGKPYDPGSCEVDVGICTGLSCPCPAQAISLTATPTRVQQGTKSTITWSVPGVEANGTTCEIRSSAGSLAPFPKSFTVNTCTTATASSTLTHDITSQTTFTITCGSVTDDAIVNVFPSIDEN